MSRRYERPFGCVYHPSFAVIAHRNHHATVLQNRRLGHVHIDTFDADHRSNHDTRLHANYAEFRSLHPHDQQGVIDNIKQRRR